MATEDSTTDSIGLNLPGIGTRTNWATQYRENFQQLDAILNGDEAIPGPAIQAISGPIVGDHPEGQDAITSLTGTGLFIDEHGVLQVNETTGEDELIAQSRRRLLTPVGDA